MTGEPVHQSWRGLGVVAGLIGSIVASACGGDSNGARAPAGTGGSSGAGASAGSGKDGSASGVGGSSTGGSSGSSTGGTATGGSSGQGGAGGSVAVTGGTSGSSAGGAGGESGDEGSAGVNPGGSAGTAGSGGVSGASGSAGSAGRGGSAGDGAVEYRACEHIGGITRYELFRIDRAGSTCTVVLLAEDVGLCTSGIADGDWCLRAASITSDVASCETGIPTNVVHATDRSGTISVGASIAVDLDLTFPRGENLPEAVSFEVTGCTPNCMASDCRTP